MYIGEFPHLGIQDVLYTYSSLHAGVWIWPVFFTTARTRPIMMSPVVGNQAQLVSLLTINGVHLPQAR